MTSWQPPTTCKDPVVDLQLEDGTEVPCCYKRGDEYICCIRGRDQKVSSQAVDKVRPTLYVQGPINR